MSVLGIGGFFFRARDPEALARWYADYLGIGPAEAGKDPFWYTADGPVLFQPFARDSDYFPPDQPFMLNLRVADLGRLIFDLRSAGVAVETRAEWDDPATGRFARIHDPEGNPIELWEPPEG